MSRTSKLSPWLCCLATALTLSLLGTAFVTPCTAQDAPTTGGKQYKQLTPNMKLRSESSTISNMLTDGIPNGSEAKFDRYYKEYVFPQWTLTKNLSKLPALRKSLITRDFSRARNAGSYQRLLQVTLDNLTPMATSSDYHPAVRFNATVMLGRLNSTYTPGGSTPTAYPNALPILLRLLNDENENDAARFSALLGVVRHAEFNTDETSRPQIIDTLIKQTSNQEAPMGRSSAGHAWFRSTAVEGLGNAKGEEVKKAAPALVKIINDSTESDTIRREAATSLGELSLTAESGVDPVATARTLAKLAVDAVSEEMDACEKDTTKTINAAILKSRLLPICLALSGSHKKISPEVGLAAMAKDKDKSFVENVWNPLSEWYEKLDDRRLDPTDPSNVTPDVMGGAPMMGGAGGQAQTPARMATEELMEYFKRELQEMDNLLSKTN